MKPTYRELEHTADMGIQVCGTTVEDLFAHAGCTLFDLIVGIENITVHEKHRIEVHGNDWEDLLVVWLQELIYWFEVKKMVFGDFRIENIEPAVLVAEVAGEPFDAERHLIRNSIKAVTYHRVRICEQAEGWQARVFFDI